MRLDLAREVGRVSDLGAKRPVAEFSIDPAQGEALALVVALERPGIGIGNQGVHAHQYLAGFHLLAFPDQDILDDAGIRRLDDLEIALRHQLALGYRDDVELAQHCPD